TSWCMFRGELFTGFTFHFVNENIDDGDIVLQHGFIIDYSKSPHEIEIIKTKKACEHLPFLFYLLKEGFKGYRQEGIASYYGKKELKELTTFTRKDLENPQKIKYIQKIIKYFNMILICMDDNCKEKLHVTRVSDKGVIKRIKYLPPSLYFLLKNIKII
ncbi:MAG: hypothetical protein N2504_07780, partial [candidate division WOR-3 bacterium]|nr:hypothetical protein [candidate division WOR-3 bacterium]